MGIQIEVNLRIDQPKIETERREAEPSRWGQEHGGIQAWPRHLKSRSTRLNLGYATRQLCTHPARIPVMLLETKAASELLMLAAFVFATEQA